MKANIARRLLVPIMLALLLMAALISAIFIAGVAIALFVVGLTILPLSVWIGPVLPLFSLSGTMLTACLLVLALDTDNEQWLLLAHFLLLVSLGGSLAGSIVPPLLAALR